MMNYWGFYKATVVSIGDAKKLGRVQIRIKGLMDGIPDAHLPWAKYMSSTPGAKGGSDIRPAVASKVWVRFAEGDINDAYYVGGVIEEASDLPSSTKDGRYTLYESPNKGITITVDENTEDIEIKTKKYNTTLGTLLDLFIAHGHQTGVGPSSLPMELPSLAPIVLTNFTAGDL